MQLLSSREGNVLLSCLPLARHVCFGSTIRQRITTPEMFGGLALGKCLSRGCPFRCVLTKQATPRGPISFRHLCCIPPLYSPKKTSFSFLAPPQLTSYWAYKPSLFLCSHPSSACPPRHAIIDLVFTERYILDTIISLRWMTRH